MIDWPDCTTDEDHDLMLRAEAKCTGADVHPVRTTTCILSGEGFLGRKDTPKIRSLRLVLKDYLNGVSIREAIKRHPYKE